MTVKPGEKVLTGDVIVYAKPKHLAEIVDLSKAQAAILQENLANAKVAAMTQVVEEPELAF